MDLFQQPWYVTIFPTLPILLAHLAGIVVTIVLLVRRRSTPAVLALMGFGLLFIMGIVGLLRGPLVNFVVEQGGLRGQFGPRQFLLINSGVGCCCSVVDVIALACLIVAIWQAVSASGAGDQTGGEISGDGGNRGEDTEVSEKGSEANPYATRVLDEENIVDGSWEALDEDDEGGE